MLAENAWIIFHYSLIPFLFMNAETLLQRALNLEFLSISEGQYLFENAPTSELMDVANEIRKKFKYNECMYCKLQILQLLSDSRPCGGIHYYNRSVQTKDRRDLPLWRRTIIAPRRTSSRSRSEILC